MKIQCPRCRRGVPAGQVNMSTDLALCPECNESFKVSESLDLDSVNADILRDPPSGAWFRREIDEAVVGASTRSPIAFFLVPFMCVWSGFSLGGIYGSQILSGKFNLGMSLFGIPFVLGSILFWAFALMAVCGKVEVGVGRSGGSVFVGIGRLGWTRRFDWSAVRVIREEAGGTNYPGSSYAGIVLEGQRRLKFGSNLNESRRHFILHALRYLKTRSA